MISFSYELRIDQSTILYDRHRGRAFRLIASPFAQPAKSACLAIFEMWSATNDRKGVPRLALVRCEPSMRPRPKSDIPLLMEQSQLKLFLRYNHTTVRTNFERTMRRAQRQSNDWVDNPTDTVHRLDLRQVDLRDGISRFLAIQTDRSID